MAVVPANLLFGRFVYSAFFHHDSNLFDGLVALRLIKNIANIGMFLETRMEEFEHMRSDAFQIGFEWVLLIQLKVFHHELIHVMYATLIKEGWIFKDALT